MENNRPYHGRKSSAHRRRTYSSSSQQSGTSHRAVRLYVCIGLFIAAVLLKFIFPATFAGIGEKINTVVNYKAALATLGEGISGEKKFTSALGEAFTYAFTGQDPDTVGDGNETGQNATDNDGKAKAGDGDTSSGKTEEAVAAMAEEDGAATTDGEAAATDGEAAATDGEAATTDGEAVATDGEAAATPGKTFADAVIAAFMDNQGAYSDYAIPAGVTYGMPKIMIDYTTPLSGVVSSPFGYRVHPTAGVVRFHYGTDIAAESGTKITAFADAKIITAAESETLGNYVILNHGNVETLYAHCSHVFASTGQAIEMGQEIATVGMTGDATNPHLHFEMKINGIYVNPEYYLQWS